MKLFAPKNVTSKKKILIGSGLLILLVGSIYFAMTQTSQEEAIPEIVDFNYHIRPILSDRCFKCHGPDAKARKAGLRLDTEEGAFAALKDDPAHHVLVPGDPLQSAMYTRMVSTDTSEVMPPPSSNLSLTKNEIEIIKKWISQGAKFKKHWSFLAIIRSKNFHVLTLNRNYVHFRSLSMC